MIAKLFSFFSGAGFLDLGFEAEGFQVVFVNEYLPAFLNAYKHSRQILKMESPEYGYYGGSITDFFSEPTLGSKLASQVKQARGEGSLVGFIGGSPCPDFSVGGKNRGRHGENGKLSLSYVRLICLQRPDFLVFCTWRVKRWLLLRFT